MATCETEMGAADPDLRYVPDRALLGLRYTGDEGRANRDKTNPERLAGSAAREWVRIPTGASI